MTLGMVWNRSKTAALPKLPTRADTDSWELQLGVELVEPANSDSLEFFRRLRASLETARQGLDLSFLPVLPGSGSA